MYEPKHTEREFSQTLGKICKYGIEVMFVPFVCMFMTCNRDSISTLSCSKYGT